MHEPVCVVLLTEFRPFIIQEDGKVTDAFMSLLIIVMDYLLVSAVQLVTKRTEHIRPVPAALHWFPVTFRTDSELGY